MDMDVLTTSSDAKHVTTKPNQITSSSSSLERQGQGAAGGVPIHLQHGQLKTPKKKGNKREEYSEEEKEEIVKHVMRNGIKNSTTEWYWEGAKIYGTTGLLRTPGGLKQAYKNLKKNALVRQRLVDRFGDVGSPPTTPVGSPRLPRTIKEQNTPEVEPAINFAIVTEQQQDSPPIVAERPTARVTPIRRKVE